MSKKGQRKLGYLGVIHDNCKEDFFFLTILRRKESIDFFSNGAGNWHYMVMVKRLQRMWKGRNAQLFIYIFKK